MEFGSFQEDIVILLNTRLANANLKPDNWGIVTHSYEGARKHD